MARVGRFVRLQVRMTEEELAFLRRSADLAGLTVSEWVRRCTVVCAVHQEVGLRSILSQPPAQEAGLPDPENKANNQTEIVD